ncbi:hypothetical protein [Flavobacterium xinjiangense]|uniref:LVIVD repeat-containing protein n=1 Tax=Flavobacterium xinjiangense TaxID=178356 RepID=A0A1M7P674_9FLAO|nr:hypothetical protein [Flavobacterium xinjiangense]SHN12172.1 hypothetical protein SAMN05216269_11429 [Flavobacterium xinjiangense]
MTAVNDASGSGYWVITQFTDNFYAFKVTTTGVSSTPVKSTVGPSVPTFGYRRNAIGYLKVSPNGEKLAAAYDQIDTATSPYNNYKGSVYIFDFDALTGAVFNPKLILTEVKAYGVEFSTNSKVLYASFNCSVDNSYLLAQFDLLSIDIPNSKTEIFSGSYGIGALQLAPNKKNYYCTYNLNSLAIINNPDVLGLGCNFDEAGQPLANNTSRLLGLPPFITSFFDAFFDVKKLCFGAATEFTKCNTSDNSSQLGSWRWNFFD